MEDFTPCIPPAYAHQKAGTEFILANKTVLDTSEPGTGKTRTVLDAISEYRKTPDAGTALVIAPKSILGPAWANDCRKFTPHLTVSIASANNRQPAFLRQADIYITNHDAAVWCAAHVHVLKAAGIKAVFVDESTAFKHPTSARSKAMRRIISALDPELRVMMSGTPNTNNLLDIWHQVLLLDDGERLGRNFYKFRQAVCTPTPIPGTRHFAWEPKPDADEVIADLVADITIRNRLEDCTDIPEHSVHVIPYVLSPKARKAYTDLARHARTVLEDATISAVNAAVLHTKLMQVASGASYTGEAREYAVVDNGRYELVRDLVLQRKQCVVAYHWMHQHDALAKAFTEAGITFRSINGEASSEHRAETVRQFNRGQIQVVLAHPQSAGHGLTLTGGTSTIWPNPTSNAELYLQFNRRIYRNGQTQKTETLVVLAQDTIETASYERCIDRAKAQESILTLLRNSL